MRPDGESDGVVHRHCDGVWAGASTASGSTERNDARLFTGPAHEVPGIGAEGSATHAGAQALNR